MLWERKGLSVLEKERIGIIGNDHDDLIKTEGFGANCVDAAYGFWKDMKCFDWGHNGSLMRCPPIAIMCLDRSRTETFQAALDMCVL